MSLPKNSPIIPVVADIASILPGLGFQEYAEAIADAIRGGEPPQFTIGLYGQWGSGKSSLLNAIAANLESRKGVITVKFDAWRYERSEHIIVPLLYAIYESIAKDGDMGLAADLKRALVSVLYSLNFSINLMGIKVDSQDVKKNWKFEGLPALDEAFSKPFTEMRKISLGLKGRRIAVLIDDLDRCSPENVVAVLESINLVMDIPGFIFVLALDYDVLVSAITMKYPHVSGDAFIQKMVQIPFRVPRLSLDHSNFLSELIPNWESWNTSFPAKFSTCIRDISMLGLEANPRQIKRLINSFLLLQRVVITRKLDIDLELMAALVGVQLRWPAQFRDLLDAVLSNERNPFSVLSADKDDPELLRFAKRFFSGKYANEDLREILQLTAVVAGEDTSAPGPASAIREQNRAGFIEELIKRGFTQSARSTRLYYHENLATTRFLITKHMARLENRNGYQWDLKGSYLLTTQMSNALAAIDTALAALKLST